MRKNKMMRVASALLVAVLLTTCAISGTFAKYTTTGTGTDTARVAKWGVTVNAQGSAFANTYATDDQTVVGTIANSVVGGNSAKVIAPGTSGTMVAASISGTPEVAVKVTYEATVTLEGWTASNAYYCPLEITMGSDTLKGTDYTSSTEFASAIKDKIDALTNTYAAGTDLSTQAANAISWEWAFEGNDDAKDTALGNADTAPTISITMKVTVTQVN